MGLLLTEGGVCAFCIRWRSFSKAGCDMLSSTQHDIGDANAWRAVFQAGLDKA